MMNKTIIKIFLCFIITAAVVSTILLIINFIGFAVLSSEGSHFYGSHPKKILTEISENLEVTESGFTLNKNFIPRDSWAILLNDNGDIVWSQNKPSDIPDHYSLKDIARISKWFLNDYPVYTSIEDYGIIILGLPKNAVGKYSIEYSMDWFNTLPKRIVKVILVNLCLALLFASVLGLRLYKRLKILIEGINDLRREKYVDLNEKGIFKELSRSINETSKSIERKNALLSVRDNARLNWINGISHDIRTPLSVVLGNAEVLENKAELQESDKQRASVIKNQSLKIKTLIEDLNIISSLEYDMQTTKKNSVRICPLIRQIVADIVNTDLSEKYTIELDLRNENAVILGDETLIERALFNQINNCIVHNENGCNIKISQYVKSNNVIITIKDNGKGVPEKVLLNIDQIPKTTHGIGLPMAYKIITLHGGKMTLKNNYGLEINIEIPTETN